MPSSTASNDGPDADESWRAGPSNHPMSDISDRYRRVASGFTARLRAVPDDAWDNPAPCDGWLARDVVAHLVEWVPSFFDTYAGLKLPGGSWDALDAGLRAALGDPETASRTFEMRGQTYSVEEAIGTFVLGDVLVHTWDLARATGLDEALDADEVHRLYKGMEPIDDVLRASGQYGPRIHVPDDADEQTKLIAFTGRQP